MQHASLTGSGSTGRTGHDGNLFGGEFFLFHWDSMRKYRPRNSSILHTIRIRRCLSVPPGKYGGADSTPPTEISPTSQSCPLLHRFSGPSFGSIDMESQQGIELRVPPQKPNEV